MDETQLLEATPMAQQVLGARSDSLSLVPGTQMVEEVLPRQVVLWPPHLHCGMYMHTDRQLDDRQAPKLAFRWQSSKCKGNLTSIYLELESGSGRGLTSQVCLLPSAGIKDLCHHTLDVQIVYRTQQNTWMYLLPYYKGYFKNESVRWREAESK